MDIHFVESYLQKKEKRALKNIEYSDIIKNNQNDIVL